MKETHLHPHSPLCSWGWTPDGPMQSPRGWGREGPREGSLTVQGVRRSIHRRSHSGRGTTRRDISLELGDKEQERLLPAG